MANTKTTSATDAETLELVFERQFQAIVDAALSTVDTDDKPGDLTTACSLEMDLGKPPCIVCAVTRAEEAIPETGLWNCRWAIEFRFDINDTGFIDHLYRVLLSAVSRDNAYTDLAGNERHVAERSLLWDQELERELAEKTESRVIAGTGVFGLFDTYIRRETNANLLRETGDPFRTENAA